MHEPLAIDGGKPVISSPVKDRWRRVHARSVVAIARYGWRDVNTLAAGEGPIAEFEEAFAQRTQRAYGLAMNSGTATLHSAYFAAGVRPGTEVIVPAYTFFASAAPILQCGGTPVFCDVDPVTLTADPDDVERRITPRTRAICVVHVWGNPARMDRFREIADRHGVALIEDCSHAHGGSFAGRPLGSWGDIGCFSLQGKKAVSGGEAGIAVCDDPELFDRMLLLGHYGRLKAGQAADTFDTDFLALGVKYRPHLAAVLMARESLRRLDELNRRRRHNYEILTEGLADHPALEAVATTPNSERGGLLEFIVHYRPEHAGGWDVHRFIEAAAAEGVPVAEERYARVGTHQRALHKSPIFSTLDVSQLGGWLDRTRTGSDPVELPVTEGLAGRLLKLPALTKVPERYVRDIARALRKVADHAARNEIIVDGQREPAREVAHV
jgi:perosamine synthetase